MAPVISRKVLSGLEDQTFHDYRALRDAVLAKFNKHIREYPPGYTYLDTLERGFENNWIVKHPDLSYTVRTGLKDYQPPLSSPISTS